MGAAITLAKQSSESVWSSPIATSTEGVDEGAACLQMLSCASQSTTGTPQRNFVPTLPPYTYKPINPYTPLCKHHWTGNWCELQQWDGGPLPWQCYLQLLQDPVIKRVAAVTVHNTATVNYKCTTCTLQFTCTWVQESKSGFGFLSQHKPSSW